ncbi:MAG: NAD/NADP octopine/nopaline dehydrogenase family protein [Dehalococcoidia bacterium]
MAKMERVAVLGGGNGAHAMAADLALKGVEVNICEAPEFKEGFRTTLESRKIKLLDMWANEKIVELNKATTDFSEAIKGVSYIMLPVPATGHRRFFEGIMPHLENGQVIVTWPGNYSGLLFANMLREGKVDKSVTIAEVHTLPWGCRLESPGVIKIMVEAWNLLLATFPAKNTNSVINDLKEFYPVVPGENVLATSLNNLNPIVHPVATLLNAGWIDTLGKDFHLYRFGTTFSVSKAIKAIYKEVAKLSQTIGVGMLEYPENSFRSRETIMSYYFEAPFDREGIVGDISGPSSVKGRYITEDVPYGLVIISQLARKFGVEVPIIDSVITLASVINEADYYGEGRPLEDLGIAGLNKNELAKVLQDGF